MNVITTAIRTAGLGCIEGESRYYDQVDRIVDKGGYFDLVRSARNDVIRIAKKNWKVEIQ